MLGWIKARKIRKETAHDLYMASVAQARHPEFYAQYGVLDTAEGRFEMICVHASLVLEFLYHHDKKRLAQTFFDVMFRDIDRNLREEGVGDLAVPKRIKKMMKHLKGCHGSYKKAVETGNVTDVKGVIDRNIHVASAHHVEALATHIAQSYEHIKTVSFDDASAHPQTLFTEPSYEQKRSA